ncbi:hydroxysteroid dehydrogenase-like protein 2 isoform X2 [Alexandromys fortis]|uniref:hydroxysteroid dehydrogenase-like protein 2 isoform X2 n=1 Tax=Alexandromys fortis TaxID=100897 RepID=UPI002152E942|nr:hydroxysteroid dehydrogenase-like protein 2 isoform X2 [Microtus fortis]
MLPNTGKLAGCTIFITGASRGIGKAIALKAAKDGANIVIAAKTTQTHPKLPGTIYTAAEEIEAAGGKALPCVVDVRDEEQITSAVERAVERFGGIDILVNNASAISLTNTLDTPTKRVDLMMNVNTRGTYLTSKACIPFLRKSKVAHILNLSPPLNLNPLWFKQHCAYTIAKYGMSMCVLGMAEEFRGEIAVNALWPKTGHPLLPDFFLDEHPDEIMKETESHAPVPEVKEEKPQSEPQPPPRPQLQSQPPPPQPSSPQPQLRPQRPPPLLQQQQPSRPHFGAVEETFRIVKDSLSDEVVKATQAVYQFELSGEDGGTWFLDLKSKGGKVGHGEPSDRADVVMSMTTDDFVKMFSGKLKPTMAFMSGKLKIKGNMALAIKLEKLMTQMNAKL